LSETNTRDGEKVHGFNLLIVVSELLLEFGGSHFEGVPGKGHGDYNRRDGKIK